MSVDIQRELDEMAGKIEFITFVDKKKKETALKTALSVESN